MNIGVPICYANALVHCRRYYVIAELLGGLLAGFVSWPLYGTGKPVSDALEVNARSITYGPAALQC